MNESRNDGLSRRHFLGTAAAAAVATGLPSGSASAATHTPPDHARWHQRAAHVKITRDDWGVAHIEGKSDADAVFGMIYAQAEDDFPRIERNYLVSLGRLAEAEGEAAIWQDLRQRLFIDPEQLRRELYARSPRWLRELMEAWADGLNFFLATHREVRPQVITRYEPWMALSFTEGSIGGDIERVNLNQLRAFYDTAAAPMAAEAVQEREPTGSNGIATRAAHHARPQGAAADQPAHELLLPLGTAHDQRRRARRLRRDHLGAVLRLPGVQRELRLDAHVDRRRQRRRVRRDDRDRAGRQPLLPLRRRAAAGREEDHHAVLPHGRRRACPAQLHHLRHASRPDRAPGVRQVDRVRADEQARRGAAAELPAHQGAQLLGIHHRRGL